MSNRFALLTALASLSLIGVGCSETANTGETVDIPAINMSCTSADCQAYVGANPRMLAYITSSGCVSPAVGTVRSSSTTTISCTFGVGCSGFFSTWIDTGASTTTTMPSGTYSICVIVDYDRGNVTGAAESGDSSGELNSAAIGSGSGTQFVTSFTDVP